MRQAQNYAMHAAQDGLSGLSELTRVDLTHAPKDKKEWQRLVLWSFWALNM